MSRKLLDHSSTFTDRLQNYDLSSPTQQCYDSFVEGAKVQANAGQQAWHLVAHTEAAGVARELRNRLGKKVVGNGGVMYVEQGREMVASRETREEENAIRLLDRRQRRIERARDDLQKYQQREEREIQRGIEAVDHEFQQQANYWSKTDAQHNASTTLKRQKYSRVSKMSIGSYTSRHRRLRTPKDNGYCDSLTRLLQRQTG